MDGIGKILPAEGYIARLNGDLPVDYTTSLSHLYQPLVGPYAVTLYQTLLNEADLQHDSPRTHHTLMSYTSLPLNDIYNTRLRLEGIGLLKTYETEIQNQKLYVYALQCPFSPTAFFSDGMLSQLLYHHVGDRLYEKLRTYFQKHEDRSTLNEVTASFQDVFHTHQPSQENASLHETTVPTEETHSNEDDVSWLEQMLKQQMISVQNVLTGANRRLIQQMMDLYDLADYEIEKSLLWALDEENKLDTAEFKTACHDLFRTKKQTTKIQLTDKQEVSDQSQASDKPTTKEEQLVHNFEKSSPKEVLEDFSQGGTASSQDMKVIRDVMTTQQLPVPVMNVLIHYALLQSNMKLSKPYLETIASHWSRANLTTAEEAMAFAKKQNERAHKPKNRKRTKQHSSSNEVIPDWFQAQEDAKKEDKKKDSKQPIDEEQEVSEVAELLKEFTNHG